MTTKPVKGSKLQQMMGEKFLRVRSHYGVTLQTLSDEMQCSINTIRWHEAGHRCLRADGLAKAAAIIGCCPTDLIVDFREVSYG
ncbi:HTH_XRE domain containing protein [uncultured Caudovirales phage]|uniref:HTH_XRE domain containing protein n=1 Tax=uncultured Caudovirales phage TaxID=2100421 RepID=A0A6J7WQB6_9CAUD|nr:HTH_XRE domain containing protein [uncultured Caudovirales phage]